MNYKTLIAAAIILGSSFGTGQTRTIGLFLNDSTKTLKGYTLFAPKQNTMTFLINNDGRIINQWTKSQYPPGQSVYLRENGNLLRTCMTPGNLGTGGGEGGRIEEYSWNDSLVWYLNYSTTTYMQHHDFKRLPNGNIIMLVVEKKLAAEIVAAGFDTSKIQDPDYSQKKMMLPDCVIEIKPTYPSGGIVVWQWHVWDHLVQNFDPTKSNYYGVNGPSLHPELIDAAGDHKNLPLFWNHMNSIDYNPTLDQIALSVRGNSEVWIIDHSADSVQARGHTGGKQGKGGDLLYRWGNPITYGAGTASDEKYFQQHDVEWIKSDCPGSGDLLCFNNGIGRNYSTIDEITPPVDSSGKYSFVSGKAFGPQSFTWSYSATPPTSLYAEDISGAQRLPNGNTIITYGTRGTFLEVTSSGTLVWKYICPVNAAGLMTQGDTLPPDPSHPGEYLNSVFRIYKYPVTYAAFTGRTLLPGNYIEKYPTSVEHELNQLPSSFELFQNYPNPFNPTTVISYRISGVGTQYIVSLRVYDVLGREVAMLVNEVKPAGSYQVQWNAEGMPSGIYFYQLQARQTTSGQAGSILQTKKMILMK